MSQEIFPPMELVDSIHEMIHGGARQKARFIAARMGIPYNTLAKYALPCNGEDKPHPLPAHLLAPLTLAADSFLALDSIEAAVGRVSFPIPRNNETPDRLTAGVLAACQEFGHLSTEVCTALEDGKVSIKECKRIKAEGLELMRAVASLIARCEESAR